MICLWRNVLFTTVLLSLPHCCHSLSAPRKITRNSIAGLWRLTNAKSTLPTTTETSSTSSGEHLLRLNDDGLFEEAVDGDDERETKTTSDSSFLGLRPSIRGQWEYQDGTLLLAADRLDETKDDEGDKEAEGHRQYRYRVGADSYIHDVLLEVRLGDDDDDAIDIATSSSSIQQQQQQDDGTESLSSQGSIRIGKFVYPPKHSRFFEEPVVLQPSLVGTFRLQQIVSNHRFGDDGEYDENRFIEKFRREDFANKTFWLTSYPLPTRRSTNSNSASNKRPSSSSSLSSSSQRHHTDSSLLVPIRVVRVAFYTNYSFAITDGVGSSVVLRGKWDITGEERDEFWMQISRFGFGRSVSGSTFSEGAALSHEDAKLYRGSIVREDEEGNRGGVENEYSGFPDGDGGLEEQSSNTRIRVKGEVLLGRVTPHREALFEMRQVVEEEDDDDDDDEEEEKEEDGDVGMDEDEYDWNNDGDAFQ